MAVRSSIHNRKINVKNSPGRPTVITSDVVSLLAECFRSGMTVREACWQSCISHEAYYNHLRTHQQFADIMARAQAAPTMSARRVIVEAISNSDVSAAKWWLERKAPDEFGNNAKPIKEDAVVAKNRFADMSDDEMNKIGRELAELMIRD